MSTEISTRALARAVRILDWELVDMGDSYEETVDFLCEKAGIPYSPDEDSEIMLALAEKAYEINFNNDPVFNLDVLTEYYLESELALRHRICFDNGDETLDALQTFITYVKDVCEDKLILARATELERKFEKTNWQFYQLCNKIGYANFSRYDGGYFLRTNSCATIGYPNDEYDWLSECGEEYVSFASFDLPSEKKGGYDGLIRPFEGFVIGYKPLKEGAVATIYREIRKDGTRHLEKEVNSSPIEVKNLDEAYKVAVEINRLTRELFNDKTTMHWEPVKLPNTQRGAVANSVGELAAVLKCAPKEYSITPCGSVQWGVLVDHDQQVVLIDEPSYLEELLCEQVDERRLMEKEAASEN